MLILILLLTLSSFFININFSRKIGISGSEIVSSSLMGSILVLSLLNFYQIVIMGLSTDLFSWNWIYVGIISMDFIFINDNLTAIMIVVVNSISSLVHYYSRFYMEGDPHLPRFLSYLSFFTFLMLILVSSSNLVQLFIGWEGVGLCSYLLVSYWYTRNSAVKSALKAILVNRFGDLGFIMGSLIIWFYIGSLSFNDINSFSNNSYNLCLLSSICFIIAAAGKSAQFGLHSWLPDAMEGPTPVSALIHAATMVTAGIFLIIRISNIFNYYSVSTSVILLLGSLTALFAASVGLLQNDFKKVIAYSTCSQLGYMALVCGIGEFSLSLFHLFNHAFFKALLFLSAGSLIHSLSDEQDFRKSGNLKWSSPLSLICVVIGSLSLMGLPFLTGFYSKDTILELVNVNFNLSCGFWLGLIAASFTAFYSFRLLLLGIIKEEKGSLLTKLLSLESSIYLNLSLILLGFLSIFVGFLSMNFFKLDSLPQINSFNKQLPLIFTIVGTLLTFILCSSNFISKIIINKNVQSIFGFLRNAWSYDVVIHFILSKRILRLGEFFYHKIDRQSIEYFGPWRVSQSLVRLTTISNFYLTGWIYNYLIFFFAFSIIFILFKCLILFL